MIKCTTVGVEPSNMCYEICVMAKRCGALKAWEREHKNDHIEQTERDGRVMSIYIKGVNKPKTCDDCYLDFIYCAKTCGFAKDLCPIVEVAESHGDLIDNEVIGEALQALEKCEDIVRSTLDIVRSELWKIPTVIEAEDK